MATSKDNGKFSVFERVWPRKHEPPSEREIKPDETCNDLKKSFREQLLCNENNFAMREKYRFKSLVAILIFVLFVIAIFKGVPLVIEYKDGSVGVNKVAAVAYINEYERSQQRLNNIEISERQNCHIIELI